MAHRLGGLLCLAIAAGFGWWGIWLPYQEALAQVPNVDYDIKVFVLVPFAAVFGVFFSIFGDSVAYRNAEKQSPTLAGLILMVVAMAAGGLGFWWFDSRFEELGYSVEGSGKVEAQEILPHPAGTPDPQAPRR